MSNEKLVEKWKSLSSNLDKTLFQEYVTFCNYSTQKDFENYFKVQDIDISDLLSLLDFFYSNNCFNLMFKLLSDNIERFTMLDIEDVRDIKLRDDFEERMKRLNI